MPWLQVYTPISGSVGKSALVAAIPLAVIFICLALVRMKAHLAGLLAVASAAIVAVFVWGMPVKLAALATVQGAAFGVYPLFYIVLTTLFLYNITVEGGQFEIIRASLATVTGDARLQALLIAFCFGAFLEGAAGFGTPVAIAGATLAGLGFRPLHAAKVCLIANTAPVAFGAIGIAIISLAGVMGLNDTGLMKLSTMVGRQLPIMSLFIPLYIMVVMVGFKRSMEVFPAIAVCGFTFAFFQWLIASYFGPYLPDIIASLAAMAALILLLKFWHPSSPFTYAEEAPAAERPRYTAGQVARAWAPYIALTLMVLLWGVPAIKSSLDRFTHLIPVRGLDGQIVRNLPGTAAAPVAARFKLDLAAAAGSAIFIAALASAAICGLGFRSTVRVFGKTLHDMRYPALTIASILGLAYLMNASGMTTSLGLAFTRTGGWYPFISPFLGWLGVFLTGSDTSSNVLFGGLQQTAARQLGLNPLLTGAANASGGVMGKMISPQSLAVATAATGMVGEEGTLFRFTLKHSLFLVSMVGLIVYLQAHGLSGMIPK